MPVEEVIRAHRKFGKRLESIGFTVSSKGRQIIVKFGKKLNIIECPTIEAAQSLAEGFNATIKSRAEQINEFITLMESNCQQLNLFAQPKKEVIPSMVPNGIFMNLNPPDEEPAPAPTVNPFEGADTEPISVVTEAMRGDYEPVPTEIPYDGLEETPDNHHDDVADHVKSAGNYNQ